MSGPFSKTIEEAQKNGQVDIENYSWYPIFSSFLWMIFRDISIFLKFQSVLRNLFQLRINHAGAVRKVWNPLILYLHILVDILVYIFILVDYNFCRHIEIRNGTILLKILLLPVFYYFDWNLLVILYCFHDLIFSLSNF